MGGMISDKEESMVNFMTARCSGSVSAKEAEIIPPPPLCLTVGVVSTGMLFGFH